MDVLVKHEVQFEMLREQVRQGLLQFTQLPPTKNLVESTQLVQKVDELQARQGETQG